jgi:hypothetical protein
LYSLDFKIEFFYFGAFFSGRTIFTRHIDLVSYFGVQAAATATVVYFLCESDFVIFKAKKSAFTAYCRRRLGSRALRDEHTPITAWSCFPDDNTSNTDCTPTFDTDEQLFNACKSERINYDEAQVAHT